MASKLLELLIETRKGFSKCSRALPELEEAEALKRTAASLHLASCDEDLNGEDRTQLSGETAVTGRHIR